MESLKKAGVLTGGPTHPLGLPLPYGTTKDAGEEGQFLEDELTVTDPLKLQALQAEADKLPQLLVSDIEVNWLQVIGEGWAAPLKGFLREGPLMQVLHFNSLVVDPFNRTGAAEVNQKQTDWNDYKTRGQERVGLSVPIVLPVTAYTKAAIEGSVKKAVALVDKDGRTLAILRNPEVSRCVLP
jgi:3'-phosphoadenosine 5'-phosphosulfate synthase